MARILVQRGTSSNASRSTGSSSSSGTESQVSSNVQVPPATIDGETTDEKQEEVNVVEQAECSDAKDEPVDREDDEGLIVSENVVVVGSEDVDCDSPVSGGDDPDSPPIPFPPPKPSSNVTPDNRRSVLGSFGAFRMGSTQRGAGPTGSHPSSPRSHSENEGYNSSDEHMPCFVLSHAGSGSGSGLEREHEFETEI
ncbi:hypothetical protein Bca101_081476 [Brassica carinata]